MLTYAFFYGERREAYIQIIYLILVTHHVEVSMVAFAILF